MLSLFKQKRMLVKSKGGAITLVLWFLIMSIVHAQNFSQPPVAASFHGQMSMMPTKDYQQQGKIFIFLSSSMPSASLVQWFQQAQSIGATLVFRGYVHDSLPETKAWLSPLLTVQPKGGIEINPAAFESYGISQVPAVVATTGTLQCFANNPCQASAFDVVYGNMSLVQALSILAEKGELSHEVATQKLIQLKGKSV